MGLYLSDIPRQVRFEYDKLLELKDLLSAIALSATTSETAIKFDSKLSDFKVVVSHGAITGVVAQTAEWDVSLEIGATLGGTFLKVAEIALGATANEVEFAISARLCQQILPTAMYARITATKTGTPGALTYGAAIACQ